MVTKRTIRTKFNPTETFQSHIVAKVQAAVITRRSEALKKSLKEWLVDNFSHENETGSKFFEFPDTILDGVGGSYSGMELRRSVSTRLDLEKAEAIAKRKGILDKVTVPVVDEDLLYLAVQNGDLKEADIDKMLVESESFAFWPVKGEVL